VAAVEVEVGGHGVAPAQRRHACAGLDDLAGDLVADDARKRDDAPAGFGMLNRRHRLAWACDRVGALHLFERLVRSSQQHRFHSVQTSEISPSGNQV
jgi:hypothetical protein